MMQFDLLLLAYSLWRMLFPTYNVCQYLKYPLHSYLLHTAGEIVEVTPKNIRLRKAILNSNERKIQDKRKN